MFLTLFLIHPRMIHPCVNHQSGDLWAKICEFLSLNLDCSGLITLHIWFSQAGVGRKGKKAHSNVWFQVIID